MVLLAGQSKTIVKKSTKHVFSKMHVFATALLEHFWKPSLLILSHFGPPEWGLKSSQDSSNSGLFFGIFVDKCWPNFRVVFGNHIQLKPVFCKHRGF